jgi:C4-dicarboxylate-specific signal transduction histidine kinase
VRITIDGRNYETSGFQQTPWCRRAGIIVRGELRGQIEVCYLEARPEADDGPFLAEEDKLLGAVAERLGRIVERKRAQEQLRQREAQLAQVARLNMMGELASGLAHELNQPLSAVVNYTRGSLRRLEQAEHVSDEIKDALESAATQAERAGEIVHRLRRFIRKRQPMCEHVDVNTLAMEVMGWVSPEARKRGIALSLDIGKDVPSIQGDRIQIEQVLLNLAWNAMEAIDEDQDELKEVRIRTTCASDGNVELQVVDTGRGLPSDDIDHIFDAFFTTKSDGMGIGLSISRSIIEAHGGRLWATERESGGTVFRFSLPVKTGGQRDVA